MMADEATMPMNFYGHMLTLVLHIHHDLLDQATKDLLAVGIGRALGLPQGGNRLG
jgi:hypothetical protein